MKIIFATHNSNKLKEIQAMMPPFIDLVSLADIGCEQDIPETAATIEGNALLKATFIREEYNQDCFADDTGLEVEILQGEPGVHSARYAGEGRNSEDNIDKLLSQLEGQQNRQAQFKTVIALQVKNGVQLFTGICKGVITLERRGNKGFGYDAVFQPDGVGKTFAEMDLEEKSIISHRGIAFRDLVEHLSK